MGVWRLSKHLDFNGSIFGAAVAHGWCVSVVRKAIARETGTRETASGSARNQKDQERFVVGNHFDVIEDLVVLLLLLLTCFSVCFIV